MRFVAITVSGLPEEPNLTLPAEIAETLGATKSLYARSGYAPPWISYLAVEIGVVGLAAFKSAPSGGRVEIAYFTLPEFEGRGVATRMASRLIRIAREAAPGIDIRAQTLREENASVAILKKLGFALVGEVFHPEDGLVWEWSLGPGAGAR